MRLSKIYGILIKKVCISKSELWLLSWWQPNNSPTISLKLSQKSRGRNVVHFSWKSSYFKINRLTKKLCGNLFMCQSIVHSMHPTSPVYHTSRSFAVSYIQQRRTMKNKDSIHPTSPVCLRCHTFWFYNPIIRMASTGLLTVQSPHKSIQWDPGSQQSCVLTGVSINK